MSILYRFSESRRLSSVLKFMPMGRSLAVRLAQAVQLDCSGVTTETCLLRGSYLSYPLSAESVTLLPYIYYLAAPGTSVDLVNARHHSIKELFLVSGLLVHPRKDHPPPNSALPLRVSLLLLIKKGVSLHSRITFSRCWNLSTIFFRRDVPLRIKCSGCWGAGFGPKFYVVQFVFRAVLLFIDY